MPPSALLLVLASAALHAAWNFLLKRSGGTQVVVGLSKLAEVVLLLPAFLLLAAGEVPHGRVTLGFTLVAAVGVGANYVLLAQAYRHGDLSLVYPVSRGAILAFLPIAGFVALGERLSRAGVVGLAGIVGGILVLNLEAFSRAALGRVAHALGGRATLYAVGAGFVAALFTVWDKLAIQRMAPFAYMYLYTAWVALGYAAWLRTRVAPEDVIRSWRGAWRSIVAIGLMNTASYLLALLALRSGVSSYVLGIRQVSIAFGVALGWRVLGERMTAPRGLGVSMIVAGCLLLAWVGSV